MAIADIRFSLEADRGGSTGNRARAALEQAGYTKVGTSSYTADGDMQDLIAGLNACIEQLAIPGSATIDHLWVHLEDRA